MSPKNGKRKPAKLDVPPKATPSLSSPRRRAKGSELKGTGQHPAAPRGKHKEKAEAPPAVAGKKTPEPAVSKRTWLKKKRKGKK